MFNRRNIISASAASIVTLCFYDASKAENSKSLQLTGNLSPVHDPCIIKEGDTYHLFNTSHEGDPYGLIHWRTSKDLKTWSHNGALLQTFAPWVKKKLPEAKGIWAPDVSYTNGQFRIYYSVSSFGKNTSFIGMITTPTLDDSSSNFILKDHGIIFSSNATDDFNAIDPSIINDDDGKQYLSFGSFWTGLKLIEIDKTTGKPFSAKPQIISIAKRPPPGAIEAPCIIKRGEYYYLFASFDNCCRGIESTYFTGVGRSKSIKGPYLAKNNKPMMNSNYHIVAWANKTKDRFIGPGGGVIFRDNNTDYFVYHAYDTTKNGLPTLRISPLEWTQDGWPLASL